MTPRREPAHSQVQPPDMARWLIHRVSISALTANLTGAFLCAFYFMYVETGGIRPEASQQALVAALMTLGLVVMGFTFTRRYEGEIFRTLRVLQRGETLPPAQMARMQRKAINAPWVITSVTLFNWVIASLFMSGYVYLYGKPAGPGDSLAFQTFRVFFGVTVAGLATTTIAFFDLSLIFRRVRPLFFPAGGLGRVKGAHSFGLRTRLLYTLMMVSIMPMLVAALVLYHKTAALIGTDNAQAMPDIILLLAFLLSAGLGLSLVLSHMLASSVADPVQEMSAAMARVEAGDLSAEVPVRDNDELGRLGETFNGMIEGLRERDRVKETFGRFVTPEIAQAILERPPTPGGENTEVTVLFSDIRNYTTICEQMAPAQVIELLNNYFRFMVEAIESNQGLVYQFVGDGIMAVFGAPAALPDHPTHALEAGLAMQAALERFNAGHRAGQPPLSIGIGIHTGPVVAGIIGSDERMEYRVVGDTVNLTARVESLNKELGTDLLLSRATRDRLSREYPLRGFPPRLVKGKKEPVEVFTMADA